MWNKYTFFITLLSTIFLITLFAHINIFNYRTCFEREREREEGERERERERERELRTLKNNRSLVVSNRAEDKHKTLSRRLVNVFVAFVRRYKYISRLYILIA